MSQTNDVNAPGWLDAEGRLLAGRDPVSGTVFFPPQPICPGTLNESIIEPVSGRGRIYSFSVVSRAKPDVQVLAFVTLDEGPAMLTNIVDCDPATLAIGQQVELVVHERDGRPVPIFRPIA